MLALTWVDSFTGRAADLHELGTACRRAGVLFVVNASQALGARPLDVEATPIDATPIDAPACCGYKWLCGQAYWLAMQAGRGLDRMRDTTLRGDLGVRAYDVFCPASFSTPARGAPRST